jgi:hypothetical protein
MDRAMKQLISSTNRGKAGNSQAAAAARRGVFVQAYMANGHNATKAAVTLATRACTPIYRRAVTPVTLSEYRYRRMSPTHRPPWRTACTLGDASNSAGFLDGEER